MKKINKNKIYVAIGAVAIFGVFLSLAFETQAFSSKFIAPGSNAPHLPPIVVTNENSPPASKFLVTADTNNVIIGKGQVKIVNIKVLSQDSRPLTVSLELDNATQGVIGNKYVQHLPAGISYVMQPDSVVVPPNGTANAKLVITAAANALPLASFKGLIYGQTIDGKICQNNDPSTNNCINQETGSSVPLNLEITQ
jgi:hypothetical protein